VKDLSTVAHINIVDTMAEWDLLAMLSIADALENDTLQRLLHGFRDGYQGLEEL
jgi:hypothetical protein